MAAAVEKFRTTSRPFEVDRLIIGVASAVKSTKVIEELAVQRRTIKPTVLELWDAQELSKLLRNRPNIVVEFFGTPTAEAFCMPFKQSVATVPAADAAAVRDAMARTPEVSTGAQKIFDLAAVSTDPEQSLVLIGEGQEVLRAAGFGPHAALRDQERVRLLARVGRTDEAARQILDDFWAALDQGLSATAQMTQARLGELARLSPGNEKVALYRRVIEAAIGLYSNPLGLVPDIDDLRLGDQVDEVNLILLAGETALAGDQTAWLVKVVPTLYEFACLAPLDEVRRTRLRILIAETTSDWSEVCSVS